MRLKMNGQGGRIYAHKIGIKQRMHCWSHQDAIRRIVPGSMFNVCRIRDTSINPTGYRTTACEILDEQSFEFTLCHATTLRHYALAVLTSISTSGFRIGSLVAVSACFRVERG